MTQNQRGRGIKFRVLPNFWEAALVIEHLDKMILSIMPCSHSSYVGKDSPLSPKWYPMQGKNDVSHQMDLERLGKGEELDVAAADMNATYK